MFGYVICRLVWFCLLCCCVDFDAGCYRLLVVCCLDFGYRYRCCLELCGWPGGICCLLVLTVWLVAIVLVDLCLRWACLLWCLLFGSWCVVCGVLFC